MPGEMSEGERRELEGMLADAGDACAEASRKARDAARMTRWLVARHGNDGLVGRVHRMVDQAARDARGARMDLWNALWSVEEGDAE